MARFENPEEISAPVVPASPGAAAIVVTICPEPYTARPVEGSLWISRNPIVAWRICADHARVDDLASNVTYLIEMPDGKLCAPDNCTYETLESAKQSILKRRLRSLG